MEITNAEFVISNTDVKKCPAGTFPRICLYRPIQCRKIQPHQYADRTKGAGHDFRYSR